VVTRAWAMIDIWRPQGRWGKREQWVGQVKPSTLHLTWPQPTGPIRRRVKPRMWSKSVCCTDVLGFVVFLGNLETKIAFAASGCGLLSINSYNGSIVIYDWVPLFCWHWDDGHRFMDRVRAVFSFRNSKIFSELFLNFNHCQWIISPET
jgi:hypothetical protein